MACSLKSVYLAITALVLTLGQAHADSNLSMNGKCEDSCFCPPACCGKGFVSADLLYWRAFQGGLDDCFPTKDIDRVCSDGNVISNFRGSGKDPHFKWDPGFRLGTGYEFASGWDLAVFWTHFHSNSKENLGNQRRLQWKLDFEVVDIVIGSAFDLGSCFTIRPFGGLRGARIEQKLFTNSISEDVNYFNPCYCFATSCAEAKNILLGIGPLIGADAIVNLGCNFSFYVNASFSVLYGNFHIRLNESEEFCYGASFCNVKRHLHACQAVVDAGLGIRWEKCFCSTLVWLQLGLEHHRYFNQNRFGNYGDLCLDGGNFSAGFAF